jgi:hypothetical protein
MTNREPVPSFAFVNSQEIRLTLAALNRLAAKAPELIKDEEEAQLFSDLLDAFQSFALANG